MGQFSNYPVATSSDYADATTFLIQNSDGTTKLADLETLKSAYMCNIQCASLSIASADVLTLNSIPVELVAAPGAGYAIEVISASVNLVFASAAYATNTTLQLIINGATSAQVQGTILNATLSKIAKFSTVVSVSAGTTQIIENAALNVSVATGDPITGDSDIEVFVLYRLIAV